MAKSGNRVLYDILCGLAVDAANIRVRCCGLTGDGRIEGPFPKRELSTGFEEDFFSVTCRTGGSGGFQTSLGVTKIRQMTIEEGRDGLPIVTLDLHWDSGIHHK